jgi:hypothetical protein
LLLHRKGYFRQRLDEHRAPRQNSADWSPGQLLEPMKPIISVTIAGRVVHVKAWRYLLEGIIASYHTNKGHSAPGRRADGAALRCAAPPFRDA